MADQDEGRPGGAPGDDGGDPASDAAGGSGDGRGRRSLLDRAADRAAALTGELPRFVREALEDAGGDGGAEEDGPGEQPDAVAAEALSDSEQETVTALTDLGIDAPDARRAVFEGRVPLALVEQTLGGEERYDIDELAERSGLPAELIRDLRVAVGLPVPERFGDLDLRWAERIAETLDVLSPEALVRNARARGSALASIARTDMGMVRNEIVLPMREAGADDLAVSVALAETVGPLTDVARDLLVLDYELHLRSVVGSELSAMATRSEGAEIRLAVGFVDVVGYTALSARVDPHGLDEVLDAFEERAIHAVSDEPDVSLVKYLGDAVMFVAPEPVALARVLTGLTREVPELSDAPLRAGMAVGDVLVREGDFFGPPVNAAARLTDIGRAWTLLADEELRPALEEAFDLRAIRPTRIRGMGLARPLSVRRPDPEDHAGA